MGGFVCLFASLQSPASVALNTIKPNEAPFALTIEQTRQWHPNSELASIQNRSTVPLARRFDAFLPGLDIRRDTRAKVLYAPDGMNNFGNYLDTAQFNLYNFWAQRRVQLVCRYR